MIGVMDRPTPSRRRRPAPSRATRWILAAAVLALAGVAIAGWLATREPTLPDTWNEVDIPLAGMH